MNSTRPGIKRLAESPIGGLIAVLICILWIVSMAVVDGHASSFFLIGWGLGAIGLLAVLALISGYRVVRLSYLGRMGICIGLYFLIRSIYSSSLVDSWYETGLLLGAFVFYMAGIYSAQTQGMRVLLGSLMLCVVINAGAFYLMQDTTESIRILGRPEVSLGGPNTRNTSLFVYKNFAALVFALTGLMLLWYTIWRAKADATALIAGIIGCIGIAYSFLCGSRVVFIVIPLVCTLAAFLWILLTLYKGRKLNNFQFILSGVLLLGVAYFVVDCFMANRLFDFLFGTDSHLRFKIWSEAWSYVGDAPLCGHGSAAAQWVMSATYSDFQLPNYTHNEYLQAWMDYGLVGIGLMLIFIVTHIAHGVCILTSEHSNNARKHKTALALVCMLTLAAASLTDYVWHNFSLVAMTAFSAGIMASPYPRTLRLWFDLRNWAPETHQHARPLKAESGVGKYCLIALFIGAVVFSVRHSMTLQPGWQAQWDYDRLVADGATNEQRRLFLNDAVKDYPHSGIADHYALMGGGKMFWPRYEEMLRHILKHNPHQIFTAAMLADTLGRMQRFEEAEKVFRQYYPNDGPDNTALNDWAVYYATNLFAWAEQMIAQGHKEQALSMMQTADKITKSGPRPASFPNLRYRGGPRCWVDGGSRHRRRFIANCRTDMTILKAIGIKPNASWRAPLEPGGKPALYSRYKPAEN